jgi:Anthranilate phosphoribosyltransferase
VATALGVSDKAGAPLMARELSARGRSGIVFRADDGMDELSTTSENSIWEVSGGEIREHRVSASDLGLNSSTIEQLLGGDARHNAGVANDLFSGESFKNSDQIKDVVALNSAAGLVAYDLAKRPEEIEKDINERLREAFTRSYEAIESGAAQTRLEEWTKASHSA